MLRNAQKLLENGHVEDAHYYFGFALHTIQDGTSGVHEGFQVWNSHQSKKSVLFDHVSYELKPDGARKQVLDFVTKELCNAPHFSMGN